MAKKTTEEKRFSLETPADIRAVLEWAAEELLSSQAPEEKKKKALASLRWARRRVDAAERRELVRGR